MQRRFGSFSVVLGGLTLAIATAAVSLAGPSSRPSDQQANVGIERRGAAAERSLEDPGTPRIRTYGKVAIRPDRNAVTSTSEPTSTTGAGSTGAGIDATNKISGTGTVGSVTMFAVDPSGTTAVFVANRNLVDRFDLYAVPVDGSASPTRLSSGMALTGQNGVSAFQITPDGTHVVFTADPNVAGTDDLFSVPIDRSTNALRLNDTPDQPVTGFGITADSNRVVYFGTDSAHGSGGVAVYAATIGNFKSGTQLSDVGQTNALGEVDQAEFSPDSSTVLYKADAVTDDLFQWYSVPIDATGPGSDVQLSNGMSSAGTLVVSPDSGTVVYAADETTAGVFDVLAQPIGGGGTTRLNPTMAGSGASLLVFSPDGNRVGYLADQDTAGVTEVYSAMPGVAGSGMRLNSAMSGTQTADTLNISPDSSTVLYEADQDTGGTFELFGAPIDVAGSPSTLHGLTAPDDVGFFVGLGTPIIGARAVYPVFGSTTLDVFSVPFDGSGPFSQVTGAMSAADTLVSVFLPDSGSRLMAYSVGPSGQGRADEVNAVPIRGDLDPEQINVTAPEDAMGVLGYEITSDDNYGVYLQDQDTLDKPELYSKELDSDGDTVINLNDNCPYHANMSQGAVVFGSSVIADTKTSFTWTGAADVRFVRGPLGSLSSYATDDSGTLVDASSYEDATVPGADAGLYYLFAPDCSVRSYQSSLGAESGRDLASFP